MVHRSFRTLLAAGVLALCIAVVPQHAIAAGAAKNAGKGTIAVTVTGSGTYTIAGEGVSRAASAAKNFKLKPGEYVITAVGGTVDRANVKLRKGRTARVAVTFASGGGGGSKGGVPPGKYTCYGGTTTSTFWIDSASSYRDPSEKSGTYRLDPTTAPFTTGGIKIDWLTGSYADWQKEKPPFWAEYKPVGTVDTDGVASTIPTVLFTFNPVYTGVWTTCQLS